ncbi:hypothetical protein ACRRTK_009927 [Alexandromys fortis]
MMYSQIYTLWHSIRLDKQDLQMLYFNIYKVVLNIVMQPGNTYKTLQCPKR